MNKKPKRKIALTKDEALFVEQLIEQNESYIKNIIYNTLGDENRYLAEDAISEFYLLMCEKAEILKKHASPQGWILVAAKRTALGMIGKHKKDLSSVSLDEALQEPSETDVFEDAVYEIWLENKIPEKLIAALAKREKQIYHKIYIENKRPKEIAKELNISVNAVNNIHKNLRDKIKDYIKLKNF